MIKYSLSIIFEILQEIKQAYNLKISFQKKRNWKAEMN